MIAILFFVIEPGKSQITYFDFGFEKSASIPVYDSLGNPYDHPWAGGLNGSLMYKIDLDIDGIKDLVVFDRIGNRILTFLNNGTPNMVDYTYAPQYAYYLQQYPPLEQWLILKDYNCDGKEDLYSYVPGGIRIYENVSDSILKFKLYTYMLNSFYYMGYTNLYVTSVDLPGIEDIDNDGDQDILAFWGLGTYVHYHKNLAMELYSTCDTMDYKLTDECWGDFSEHENNNKLTLNDPYCTSKSNKHPLEVFEPEEKGQEKHTGSTMLLMDFDNDTVMDLLLGDVDYSNLIGLHNGGTIDSAHMIYQDTLFPSNTTGINIISFPAANYLDIDNDGVNEMIASPFDPNPYLSKNYNCVWLYENNGINSAPSFSLSNRHFLQDEMIDVGGGAYPVFFDYNNDGLDDLIVGNYGYHDSSYFDGWLSLHSLFRSSLALYENTGTKANPKFKLITRDYANLSTLYPDTMPIIAIYPAFGDLDGDDDNDMIIGNGDGKLHYFVNIAAIGNPANFQLSQMNFQNIDVGAFSTPQLIDLDRDSLLDLVIGEKEGLLNFYKNTGTITNPIFTFVTDTLGKIDVTNLNIPNASYNGYSIPCFFEDTIGKYSLFVGTEYGHLEYYTNIDNNLNGTFLKKDSINFLLDSILHYINDGFRISPAVKDIDSNGFVDLFVGNHSGGIGYYKGINPYPKSLGFDENHLEMEFSFSLFPNPADENINLLIDGLSNNDQVEVTIYNLISERIYAKKFTRQTQVRIDVSNLTPGMYICTVSYKDKNQSKYNIASKKFIVR
ncbi:T9SS type A sorting domain-containing protein [candidate division KSB1 bacterium]